MDSSLPGSSIHGIFQARVLEWGAIAFSDSLTTQSSNCPLWYLLRWVETYIHTKTCTQMFVAVLFITEKKKSLEATRRANCGTSCSGILFSNKKKTTKTWRKLKGVWLTERSHSEKATDCRSPANDILEKNKLWWCKKRSERVRGLRGGRDEQIEHRGFSGNETILYGTLSLDTINVMVQLSDPQNGHHQELNHKLTYDSGW